VKSKILSRLLGILIPLTVFNMGCGNIVRPLDFSTTRSPSGSIFDQNANLFTDYDLAANDVIKPANPANSYDDATYSVYVKKTSPLDVLLLGQSKFASGAICVFPANRTGTDTGEPILDKTSMAPLYVCSNITNGIAVFTFEGKTIASTYDSLFVTSFKDKEKMSLCLNDSTVSIVDPQAYCPDHYSVGEFR
jgi:hypothetical protein